MTDEVVCERTYQVETEDGTRPVLVQWFKPRPDPRGDWACAYRIDWPNRDTPSRAAFGVDSTQALHLALQNAATELYIARPPVFFWEPDDDLHLPTASAITDLANARTKGRP